VLLTIALTHVADFDPREKRLAFGLTLAAFSAIFQPSAALICALILGFWVLWEFGILGGAVNRRVGSEPTTTLTFVTDRNGALHF